MHLSILSVGLILTSFCFPTLAQTNEYLKNPSFEDTPQESAAPNYWFDCSYSEETPVDIHSSESEISGVREFAADGESFVGMLTRDNDTYEGISTRLLKPFLADSTYKISIMVNQASSYLSYRRGTGEEINHDSPTVLEIWGGGSYCQASIPIQDFEVHEAGNWQEFTFTFTPETLIKMITLKTHYLPGSSMPTNGHVLIDDLRITKVSPAALEID